MKKIIYVGKTEDAPESLTIGTSEIEMPEDQKKPFAHENAKLILKTFPELYKPVVPKGKKRKVHRSAETGEFVSEDFAEENPSTTVSETV